MKTIINRLGASLGVLTALAIGGAAHAEGTVTWRGNVDDVARITFRGQDVNSFALSGNNPSKTSVRRNGDTSLSGRANVSLQTLKGRGNVRIVQSPDRSNNFTTIVEVRDPQPGDGTYEFRLQLNDTDGRNGGYNNRPYDHDGYNNRPDNRNDYPRSNGRWDDRPGYRDNDNRGNGRWGDRDNRSNGDDRSNGNGRWGNRRDNRADTSLPSDPAARVAYLLGVTQGQRDHEQRRDRDYSRYGARFNNRTESDFRRGYNNGFDGYDTPRNR